MLATLRGREGKQAQLEWATATSKQKQLEFVWHQELDPIKQQIDTCKKDHKQKVQEIQAEVEFEQKARERIAELAQAKEKQISELQTQSQPSSISGPT